MLQGGCDIYGDLIEWESRHPPTIQAAAVSTGIIELMCEAQAGGEDERRSIPFRFRETHPAGYTWEHLTAEWADYIRLCPESLRPPG